MHYIHPDPSVSPRLSACGVDSPANMAGVHGRSLVTCKACLTFLEAEACRRCSGSGSVHDASCLADTCAHAGRWVRVRDEAGKVVGKKRDRVMPCPPRPCSCRAGEEFRAQLAKRARLEWERLRDVEAS